MTPRKLDTMVAERVFGWHREQNKWCLPNGAIAQDIDWSPSTQMGYAWEVVEKMQDKGYRTELVYDSQGSAYATFVIGGVRTRGDSATAPHAICLAALKAVGVSEEEIKGAMDG